MEIFGIILMLLIVLALFVGAISLVVLIVTALRKKRLKVPGIVAGASFGLAILLFVAFVILAVVDPQTNTDTATSNEKLPGSSSEANASSTEVTTAKPNANVEVEPTEQKEESKDDEVDLETDESLEKEEESEFDKNFEEIREERESKGEEDLSTEELDIDETETSEDTEEDTPQLDPEDLSNYRTDYDIKDIERNPMEYENELLSFEGSIIQVMEDDVYTSYRIAINGDYDRIVYVQTFTSTLESRLLEDDYVTVYAMFVDLLTYETVLGANQTIPAFMTSGERIVLNE